MHKCKEGSTHHILLARGSITVVGGEGVTILGQEAASYIKLQSSLPWFVELKLEISISRLLWVSE